MNMCVACETAKARKTGGGVFQLGCHACEVREVAYQPKARRELAYAAIKDPEAREAFKREVEAVQPSITPP